MKTILFVCVHNAGRSQMAEALTRHKAKELGLDVLAESAGTEGGMALNPVAMTAMEEIGIPMTGHTPKILDSEMVGRADRIVSMGCGVDAEACPSGFLLTEDWNLDDPAGKGIEQVRVIRDEIARRVAAMLEDWPRP